MGLYNEAAHQKVTGQVAIVVQGPPTCGNGGREDKQEEQVSRAGQ